MKYILLMTGAKAGVDAYKAWSEKDIGAHFAYLKGLNKELSQSGEFVANEALGPLEQAKVVRAGKDGTPITDGVFPEAKEFLSVIGWSTSKVRSELMRLPPDCRPVPAPAAYR